MATIMYCVAPRLTFPGKNSNISLLNVLKSSLDTLMWMNPFLQGECQCTSHENSSANTGYVKCLLRPTGNIPAVGLVRRCTLFLISCSFFCSQQLVASNHYAGLQLLLVVLPALSAVDTYWRTLDLGEYSPLWQYSL